MASVSPCLRGRSFANSLAVLISRYIPVRTGRIYRSLNLVLFCAAHPHAYGADQLEHFHGFLVWGSSPCIRGRSTDRQIRLSSTRLIPVYTGRILNFSKISEATKSPIRSQIPVICSVCIIFSKYVFADNAFWSKSGRNNGLSLPYMFRHNKTTGRISFSQIAIPSCVSDT